MANIYITTYALTKGIWKRELLKEVNGMAVAKCPGWLNEEGYFHGNEWHKTLEQAMERAEEMRSKKIASLRKQIDKLEVMTFAVS